MDRNLNVLVIAVAMLLTFSANADQDPLNGTWRQTSIKCFIDANDKVGRDIPSNLMLKVQQDVRLKINVVAQDGIRQGVTVVLRRAVGRCAKKQRANLTVVGDVLMETKSRSFVGSGCTLNPSTFEDKKSSSGTFKIVGSNLETEEIVEEEGLCHKGERAKTVLVKADPDEAGFYDFDTTAIEQGVSQGNQQEDSNGAGGQN